MNDSENDSMNNETCQHELMQPVYSDSEMIGYECTQCRKTFPVPETPYDQL